MSTRGLQAAKRTLANAHSLAQAELQAADDLNVDQTHAELVATAAAVLMRAVALELRARRAAAQRAEERRLRRTTVETRKQHSAAPDMGRPHATGAEVSPEFASPPQAPPLQRG